LKKSILPIIKFTLFLSVAAGLLYLALKGTDVKKIVAELKEAHYGYIYLSLIPALLAFASRAWRWKMLLHPLGYKPKFSVTFYALMFGYLANLALPRLGEVSRSVAMNRSEKIPLDVIIGTVIAERAVDVVSLLICIALTLILEFDRIYSFLVINLFEPLKDKIYIVVHSGLFYAALAVLIAAAVAFIIITRKKKHSASLMEKIILFFKGILAGLTSVIKMKNHSAFILHSVFIWVMYWLVTYICFSSLGATSSLDLKAALFVLVAGGLGMTAPVQGGIGAYHWLVSQGLLIYGISLTDGLAYATIVHASQTLLVVLAGTASFLMLSVNKNQKLAPDVSA
jgi:uncharacterized protein (TIRG00374 family)